ncbi:PAS domain S-box protein [Aeoliella straminimaris]|nr:PAS domain-containing protein [Aeoliella straminimaris]
MAQMVRADIVRRVDSYQFALQSLRCVYQSSEVVTQTEFESAARLWTSSNHLPGVLGIGYVERIPANADVAPAEGAKPEGDLRQFVQVPLAPATSPPNSGRRLDRMVIRNFHALEGSGQWIGFSLGDLAEGRLTAERSAESGKATLSAELDLALGETSRKVLLLMLPVYQKGNSGDGQFQGVGAVRGWICMVLVADQVFADITDAVGREVSFQLFDGPSDAANELFGPPPSDRAAQSNGENRFGMVQLSETVPLDMDGRQWTVTTKTTDRFFTAPRDAAWALIVSGCLVTLLVAYILQVQSRALQRARVLADCMTEELRRLAMVAQRTTNGVVIADADRKIVWANEGFTRLTGYQIEEVLGLNPGHFLQCPETDPNAQARLRNAVRGLTSYHGEILNRTKSGKKYWVDLEIQPLLKESGDLYGYIGIQSDITDRVEAERRARSLADILEEAPIGIYLVDAHTSQLVEVNSGACNQLGYTRDELIGNSVELFNSEFCEQRVRQLVEPLDSGAVDKVVFDTTHRRKDGTEYQAHVNLHRSRFAGHDVNVAFVTDLTDRLQLEQQLAQAQKLESMGQLAAGVAHEINTPMQCVVTNVEYLSEVCVNLFKVADAHRDSLHSSAKNWEDRKDELDRLETENDYEMLRQNTLDAIVESAEAATRVVEVVRAMKAMSHPGSSEKTWIDLNELVRSAVMVSKNRWKYYASVEMALDDSLPCVPLHSSQINQVLLNLLVNSADAILEQTGKEKTDELGRIELATWWESEGVMFRIRDTGCGMSEEVKRRAFDPFFTTKEIGRGTGQGLAISYDVVVQKHGGTVQIDSEVGQGTTITIWLPGQSLELAPTLESSPNRDARHDSPDHGVGV